MKVENNYNGEITYDENHLPTNYEPNHGFGTKSINLIAKHYDLNVTYDIKPDTFAIIILFN